MSENKGITLHVASGSADGECREIDLSEVIQVHGKTTKLELLKTLYGYSEGYDVAGDVLLTEFCYYESVGDARKEAGKFYNWANKGKAKEEAIAKTQADFDIAKLTQRETVMREDATDDEIDLVSLAYVKARKALEKAKTGKATSAGNGNRTNTLPKVEEGATCFIRKANGQSVLALLGKIIPNHEAHGLSAKSMQAFQMTKDGQDKGFWKWEGTLGECTSNSNLNAKINRDVLGIGGEHNSIGVNGLSAPNSDQIELIRTTQLRGLPDPK